MRISDWSSDVCSSDLTPDHVNPEAPWPHLEALAEATAAAGRILKERLAIGPAFARAPDIWLDPAIGLKVRRGVDARGLPIVDGWNDGTGDAVPSILHPGRPVATDRKSVVSGKRVAVRVSMRGLQDIKNKK